MDNSLANDDLTKTRRFGPGPSTPKNRLPRTPYAPRDDVAAPESSSDMSEEDCASDETADETSEYSSPDCLEIRVDRIERHMDMVALKFHRHREELKRTDRLIWAIIAMLAISAFITFTAELMVV